MYNRAVRPLFAPAPVVAVAGTHGFGFARGRQRTNSLKVAVRANLRETQASVSDILFEMGGRLRLVWCMAIYRMRLGDHA